MPTYEYECENCQHKFEHFQMMTDKVLRKCPNCGKFKLHRLIGSGAGIIFKGSGFYETDYKRSGAGGKAPKTAGEKPSAADKTGSATKTESSTSATPSKGKTS